MRNEDQQPNPNEYKSALQRFSQRARSLDAQLPETSGAAFGVSPLAAYRDGAVHALAAVTNTHVAPEHPLALWGACHRSELLLAWDGDGDAVAEILDNWLADAIAAFEDPTSWQSSLGVNVPSRDSHLVLPLLQRGFTQVGISAIRIGGRDTDEAAALAQLRGAVITLRQATLADAVLLAEMDCELLAHDALHGAVELREGAALVLQRGIEERLAIDPEWTWVIEQSGEPVGYLSLEINRAQHRLMCAQGGEVAYIQAMYLRPTVRGSGVGEAVIRFAHARALRAGYDRILLGYAALNPRSGPFWSRMGYRPLWSSWQRRPARLLA